MTSMNLPADAEFHLTLSVGPSAPHRLELHSDAHVVGRIMWDPHSGDIGIVETHAGFVRRGIGTALLTKAHQVADEHGHACPAGSVFWTVAGAALRDAFGRCPRPDIGHIPVVNHEGMGAGSTDLRSHMVDDHGFGASADMIRAMTVDTLEAWHTRIRRFDPCAFSG
ncbi:hypothetical protein [Nocardia sp. NPDC052566]|uniref:hypothetical protein n=1 Tax=Nocardia sp. NPDC052566 TaxID=3364330 RepID=UPI0037C60D7B